MILKRIQTLFNLYQICCPVQGFHCQWLLDGSKISLICQFNSEDSLKMTRSPKSTFWLALKLECKTRLIKVCFMRVFEGKQQLWMWKTGVVVPHPHPSAYNNEQQTLHISLKCIAFSTSISQHRYTHVYIESSYPQNPQGQRGGILGGLLRSLPVSPMVAMWRRQVSARNFGDPLAA